MAHIALVIFENDFGSIESVGLEKFIPLLNSNTWTIIAVFFGSEPPSRE
jgi:hypothetical protein